MSLIYDPRPFTPESKQRAIKELLANVAPDRDYYVLLIGAILLAVGAIFTDSIPVLIASMIVAPLAAPLLALGLGITARDTQLIFRAGTLIVVSCSIALAIAAGLAALFDEARTPDILISFTANGYIAFGIALVSGAIAAYGTIRPKVASVITGIAIAVSLMPPLVAAGLSLVPGSAPLPGAPLVFLLNVAGITLSSAIVFWCFDMGREYQKGKR